MKSKIKKEKVKNIEYKTGVSRSSLALVLLPFYFLFLTSTATSQTVKAVGSIGMTVSQMDRSVEFFSRALGFKKISDMEVTGPRIDTLQGLFGVRMRVVHMGLGEQTATLTQYLAPSGGRPVPVDSRSNDLWFQHFAIVVSDMEKAYERLRRFKVQHVSTAPQTILQSNIAAAGIKAFKFRDADGHNLELLYFPPGKGDPRWQRGKDLFLGIDHTAITVSDTKSSLKFYRDLLGMKTLGESLNVGVEQERLDNLPGARVRITGLKPAESPPGIEFLEYLAPPGGRPMPPKTRANDLWHWQVQLIVEDLGKAVERIRQYGYRVVSSAVSKYPNRKLGFSKGVLALDPDGHALLIVEK